MKTIRMISKNRALLALLAAFCLTGMFAACAPEATESLPAATSGNASQAETIAPSQAAAGEQATEPSVKQPQRERMLLWPSDVKQEIVAELPESEQTLASGVTLTVSGDVTEPTHGKLQSIGVEKASVTEEEATAILEKLQPGAEWSLMHHGTKTRVDAMCTVDGVDYSAVFATTSGDRVSSFYYHAGPDLVIREGYLMNDQELMDDWGALIEMEIPVDKDAALLQAENVLQILGAEGMQLQAAEKGCQLENDDGIDSPLTRGWVFVFVPSLDGLPVYYHGGATGFNDLIYPNLQNTCLCVYVTEQGVQMIDWRGNYRRTEALSEEVSIIPYENALDAAIERLRKKYGKWSGNGLTLSIIGVQLAAGMIGEELVSDNEAFGSHIDAGRLVPVWEVICTAEERDSAYYNYTMVLPFCALDGGAMMVQQ